MTIGVNNKYKVEKLLDWERKSLKGKFAAFSLSEKSTWVTIGLIILVLSSFGLLYPIIPPRYGFGDWEPATTVDEYQLRLTNY